MTVLNFDVALPQIFCLLSMVFITGLGFFVWSKNKKALVNTIFLFLTLALGVWEIGTFMMFGQVINDRIIFWDRFIYAGVVFYPALQYHFSVAATKKTDYRKMAIFGAYSLSIFFLILSRTDLFVSDVFLYKWGAHTKAQMFHHYFLVFVTFFFIASIYNFFTFRRDTDSTIEKHRIIYFVVAFAVLDFIGGFGFLPAYGISVYPISIISPLIFTVIIAYSIVFYRLMNVKFVLRSSVVYALALIVIGFVSWMLKNNINFVFPEAAYWFDAVILAVALLVFPLLKDYFYRIANKYFFSSLYDSNRVISSITDELSSTLETKHVFEIIDSFLLKSLHPSAIAIFDYNEKTKFYDIVFNYGFSFKRNSIKVSQYIYNNYFSKNDAVVMEDVKSTLRARAMNFVTEFRDGLGIEVIVPMNVKNKAVGLIVLGHKESGDIYNNEDIQLLNIIGRQTAMSLENSLLYEEAKSFNEKLSREVAHATSELRAANIELKRLDEAKSEFISIASHQLRTPLTVIKGYSSMMMEGSFGQINEPILGNIKKIYESNERLITLVEDLLNISRIESGRLQFNFEICQLEELVSSVVEELRVAAETKGLFMHYIKPVKPLPKVKIDKMKIRQVLINMIDNGIKYTREGGVTVDVFQDGNSIRFKVADTGIGITTQDMPYLFKKFSRGEDISVIHTEGTGLGLYVGKMMVEEHGGHVAALSEGENKGAVFTFDLPIAK